MADLETAPSGGEAIAPPPTAIDVETPPAVTALEAARGLAKWRDQQEKQAKEAAAAPKEAAPAQELAETPVSDPPQEAPAATTEEAEPAQEPPIEPPHSWTKDAKERWQSLPRDTQEYLAQREQERDRELRRSQNEAAEKLKSLTAKEQQAEQIRQQYEQAAAQQLQMLQEIQLGQFADIKSYADAAQLAQTDPNRYLAWKANQDLLEAKQREVASAQARQAQEFESKWNEFSTKEDSLLIDKAPELADKKRNSEVSDKAVSLLKDLGFADQELGRLYSGKEALSLRDHRLGLLILDAVKYREAKANVAKPAPKPVPPVQRPGVAPPKGAAQQAAVEEARERLSNAKGNASIKAAFDLYRAQRQARG